MQIWSGDMPYTWRSERHVFFFFWEACFHGCHMSLDKLWIIPHIYHFRNSHFPVSSFSHCWLNSNSSLSAPLSSSLTSHFCFYPCLFFTKSCVPLKIQIISFPLCSKCCHGFPSDWKLSSNSLPRTLFSFKNTNSSLPQGLCTFCCLGFECSFLRYSQSSSFRVSAQMLPNQSILLWPVYITQSSSIKFNTIYLSFFINCLFPLIRM